MAEDRVDESAKTERRIVNSRFVYIAALVISLVVFELTADPALVVAVGCSKFGWDHLLTARWLTKIDPNRRRGGSCWWFYVSWGLWRISLVATILMFAIVLFVVGLLANLGIAKPQGNQPPVQFIVAALMSLFGFLLSAVCAFVGLVVAWRGKTRVWVGRTALEARSRREWPPVARTWDSNKLDMLLLTAVPFALLFFVLTPIAIVVSAIYHVFKQALSDAAARFFVPVTVWVGIIGGAIGLLTVVGMAKSRMRAASPAECWPPHDTIPPSSSQTTFDSAFR